MHVRTFWNVSSVVILSFVITGKPYTKLFTYDLRMIVREAHGCLHTQTIFHLDPYNLLVKKHKLNYILPTENTRERVWGRFPGRERPWCRTLHTVAIDMPGYDALPAEKMQIISPSEVRI